MYCLPRPFAKKMMKAITSGKLNPEKLNKMTSSEVREFLEPIVGKENAKQVNLLYEKTKLLKNEEKAVYTWAKRLMGVGLEKDEAFRQKIKDTYAEKKRRVWEPTENEKFLNEIVSDVYSKKLGTEVTLEEAQKLTELGAEATTNRAKVDEKYTKEDALKFGVSKRVFDNYVGGLKSEALKRPLINPLTQKGVGGKIASIVENFKISANFIFDNSRSLRSSYDNSFWGRQGIKVMWNPRYTDLWAKNFAKSFIDIYKTLKGGGMSAKDVALGRDSIKAGDAVLDATLANVYAEKNFLNGRYETSGKKGSKLDLGGMEEEFPTSAPSKIPVLGRAFKASEIVYEAGAIRLRVDVANRLYKIAERNGRDLNDKEVVGGINELVNSMTGRGKMKLSESTQAFVNKAIFSLKFAKSNWDVLASPFKLAAEPTNFAKQQAALNLLMITLTMGTYQMMRYALDPSVVELDPRSSAWGTNIEKDTRKGITGGLRGYVTLAARILPTKHNGEWGQWSKSSVTGKFTKLTKGYKADDAIDLVENFIENKASPAAGQLMEIASQETFEGKKPTIGSVVKGLTIPLSIEETYDATQNEQSADVLEVMILEGLGISVSTYSINTNWEQSESNELKQFKYRVGAKKFKEANEAFNIYMRVWFSQVKKTEQYKNLSDDDKTKAITRQKKLVQKAIINKY